MRGQADYRLGTVDLRRMGIHGFLERTLQAYQSAMAICKSITSPYGRH